MREIKFRAYNTDLSKMIYPDEHGWFEDAYVWGGNGRLQTTLLSTIVSGEVKELVPMQYTGVKDMHGVEIYEGDLVRIPRWVDARSRKVFYHAGMFKVENGESGFSLATTMGDLACEVVGNIYEDLRKWSNT